MVPSETVSKINPWPFILLVTVLLLSQLFGSYFAGQLLRYDSFMGLWVLLRLVLPFALVLVLGIPLSKLYFGMPRFDRQSLWIVSVAAVALVGLFVYLNWFGEAYLAYYRHGQSLAQLQAAGRFQSFMIFTASTLIGWEILHRSFLLGGIQYSLFRFMQVPERSAMFIAIVTVCVFEAMFHIKKPIYESIPMVLASLVLSWLTIRTRSVWPALTIHLAIEVIFGYAAFVGV